MEDKRHFIVEFEPAFIKGKQDYYAAGHSYKTIKIIIKLIKAKNERILVDAYDLHKVGEVNSVKISEDKKWIMTYTIDADYAVRILTCKAVGKHDGKNSPYSKPRTKAELQMEEQKHIEDSVANNMLDTTVFAEPDSDPDWVEVDEETADYLRRYEAGEFANERTYTTEELADEYGISLD